VSEDQHAIMNNLNGNGLHNDHDRAGHPASAESVNPAAQNAPDAAPQEPLQAFLNHQKRALEETGKALDALLPDGFKEHSREARREFLKGMAVLADAAVNELEKAGKEADRLFKQAHQRSAPPSGTPAAGEPPRPSSTGPQKIKVQVD